MKLGIKGCCGCRACEQKCPKGAITMVTDREGFLVPRVDSQKCVDCGLCAKVCPLEKPVFHPVPADARLLYQNDSQRRMSASSGGAFETVARAWVGEADFSIFGCAWEGRVARHSEVTDWAELDRLKKSKYVRSDTGHTFQAVKQRLQEGRRVVFVGTPCQVMGLTNFLGKPQENLLTVDFVCHGTPSPLALEMYLQAEEKKYGKQAEGIGFRAKHYSVEGGWASLGVELRWTDGSRQYLPYYDSEYMNWFLAGAMSCESCYSCPFATTARCADVTLGDFWGVEKLYPELGEKQTDGVSMLLLNSPKAKALDGMLTMADARYEPVELEAVTRTNHQLVGAAQRHPQRSRFYRYLRRSEFATTVKWLTYGTPPQRLLRRLGRMIKRN